MNSDYNPLTDPVPAEVPLKNAPLLRVIAQVRFPLIAAIGEQQFIAPFQEALRKSYPVLRPERIQGVIFGPEGAIPTQEEQVWRFFDVESHWRISLAPDFVAVETTKYQSRNDLLSRFCVVLEALKEHIGPEIIDRIGLRYVDRVSGDDYSKLSEFIRPEILGIVGHPLSEHALHSLSETALKVPQHEAIIKTRWGRIPRRGSVDPAVIEPIEDDSWILDLDMYSQKTRPFDADALSNLTGEFAERLYSFFRWTVTKKFLRHYGGEV